MEEKFTVIWHSRFLDTQAFSPGHLHMNCLPLHHWMTDGDTQPAILYLLKSVSQTQYHRAPRQFPWWYVLNTRLHYLAKCVFIYWIVLIRKWYQINIHGRSPYRTTIKMKQKAKKHQGSAWLTNEGDAMVASEFQGAQGALPYHDEKNMGDLNSLLVSVIRSTLY